MQNNRRHNCRHIDLLWAIHFTMALCGGFLGSYALFSRQLVFGSAQTANLMELVSAICGRNLPEVLIRLGALALYGWGAALSVILTRKTPLNIRYASILMTGMAVFASAFIPTAVNPVIALYPRFLCNSFSVVRLHGRRRLRQLHNLLHQQCEADRAGLYRILSGERSGTQGLPGPESPVFRGHPPVLPHRRRPGISGQ